LKHRYEVLERIGEGNLFTVYKAEDKIDNRPVAVKVLLPQYAANRMFAERILVEAQAMVGMSHPGIVEVYDTGEEGGTYYVILEYIRGVDLKERIRRNAPFSLTTAVDVGLAISDVLDFAHKRGFIHGDLRPGNILVTPEGQIKITDFWVSQAVASCQSIRASAMMRSIHYMAPEVAEGKPATPAADVYSLGIILFELMSGTLPFDGDTPIAIALKHARDPVPSLRALNPGVPKSLEAVLARALQKPPDNRFRSAKSMLNELKSVRDGLNLAKPLVWSQALEKTATEPLPEPVEVAYEPDEEEPPILSAMRRALLGIVVVIFVLAAVMAAYLWTNPQEVRVPNLIGKTLDQAERIVADERIKLAVRSEQFNEDFAAGTIYYMNPSPGGTVKSGKSVDIWISKGSKFATTPALVKLTLEDAKREIIESGLNVGEISQEYSEDVPAGSVISQFPTPSTRQERSQPVNLVFSLGSEPKEPPLTSEGSASATGETRSFDVKFTVPEGEKDQTVQIVVQDDYGENIVFSEIAQPGARIEQTVDGVGNKIIIRIYINDKLVREERKWR
jgi:serine/threonine-protein kinase